MTVVDNTNALLFGHFRSPHTFEFRTIGKLSQNSGYFRLGPDVVCYGKCTVGEPAEFVTQKLFDVMEDINITDALVELPFNPGQVINNLLCERYPQVTQREMSSILRTVYYFIRPFLPVPVRRQVQKVYFRGWRKIPFPSWPVDRTVENILEQLLIVSMRSLHIKRLPFIWFWPEGHSSCTIMTHDVETSAGVHFCRELMDLNDIFNIKTSFQLVPEDRYEVPESLLGEIRDRGFELNIHDLNHDGKLMIDREEFLRSAKKINQHGRRFGAKGFRSAVLYRNADWHDALEFAYDMSIPNVAHLDPQRGGCCTIFPFFAGNMLELPVTTTQDYSLFHVLDDYSIDLWRKQISLIREKHGLISMIVHPDYVIAEKPRRVYAELLQYLSDLRSQGQTWISLPGEVAEWWRLRNGLTMIKRAGLWCIEGEGRERARLAYAVLDGDSLSYDINL